MATELAQARSEPAADVVAPAVKERDLTLASGRSASTALKPKLDAAGIPHERVDEALVRQRDEIKAVWAP